MSDDDVKAVADGEQDAQVTEGTDDPLGDVGSGAATSDDGSAATGQDDASQEAKTTEGEPDAGTGTDNSTTAPGGQSYEELRKKLNDQGIEKNTFKTQADEFRTKHQETSTALETAQKELTAYKEWYDQYYPALNELWKDPEAKKRIEAAATAKPISAKDVQKMLQEQMSEYTSKKDFEGSVDGWLKSHPDVKGQMATDIYQHLEKHDLMPTPEILEMTYTFLNKDRLKEVGAKRQELQADKLKKAAVGGGSGKGTAAPAGDPLDALFAKPASHYYPG